MFQGLLSLYNPWWGNSEWSQAGVVRELFPYFLKSISETRYITVLRGSRQTGKTFLVKQCISELLKRGTSPRNIFYFLLDDQELVNYIENNPVEFSNFLKNEALARKKIFVFFDEFQKAARLTDLIKLFYETELEIKFILTGSSSMMIANKISESMLGRTETFVLYSFSFREYLSAHAENWPFDFSLGDANHVVSKFFKAPEDGFNPLKEYYSQYHAAYQTIAAQHLPRYLLTGGYPQPALLETSEESFLRLKEIKQTFQEKDIINLLRIEKLREFDQCMRTLAAQSGQLLNFNDLQNTLGLNFQMLKNFLNILENSYLWKQLPVFRTNLISALKKRPKSYFMDLGMRNFLASTYTTNELEKEKGIVAENFCHYHLNKFVQYDLKGLGELFFWRNADGNEIDFIVKYGNSILPIEVKYQRTKQIKIPRGFTIFLQKMNLEHGIIISENTFEMRKIKQMKVYIVPAVVFGII